MEGSPLYGEPSILLYLLCAQRKASTRGELMNMRNWLNEIKKASVRKPMPVLSFPCVQLMGISVREILSSSDNQAAGMKVAADRFDSAAAVGFMDLSLEAEAFGADIKITDVNIPAVTGTLIRDIAAAEKLKIPVATEGRTGVYIDGIKKALIHIDNRPVFAGVTGPFTIAGSLTDVNRAFVYCSENSEILHILLEKVTGFLIKYIKAYRDIGANGVFMAEPLAGMLPPGLAEKFSEPYVKEIADSVRDENFIVIYHNCGNEAIKMAESIYRTGCDAYHFGNATDMKTMLEIFPEDKIVMGNLDPVALFAGGTPESVRHSTLKLLEKCSVHQNFLISSGCDIPAEAKWENIDAFFEAVRDFYEK